MPKAHAGCFAAEFQLKGVCLQIGILLQFQKAEIKEENLVTFRSKFLQKAPMK